MVRILSDYDIAFDTHRLRIDIDHKNFNAEITSQANREDVVRMLRDLSDKIMEETSEG